MSATEIIEQIKKIPASERAQVTKYFVEHGDSLVSESFKKGMAEVALAKWRGRGHLPTGKNTDDYLGMIRDGAGN